MESDSSNSEAPQEQGGEVDPVVAVEPAVSRTLFPAHPSVVLPRERPLSLVVTVICSVLFASVLVLQNLVVWIVDRADFLESPVEFLERVAERNLELEDGVLRRPAWERFFDRIQGYEPGDMRDAAIKGYESMAEEYDWLRPNRTLAVLYAEAGRTPEFEAELGTLELFEAEAPFARALKFAYGEQAPSEPVRFEEIAAQVHPAWARDRLAWRIADRQGDDAAARAARARLGRRADDLHRQMAPLVWVPVILIALSVVALGIWGATGLRSLRLGDGMTVAPWSAGRGYAVMVRAALGGIVVAESLGVVAEYVPGLEFTRGISSLVAIVPLLWFGTRHLLRPWGHTLSSGFGLWVPGVRWGRLFLFTLMLAAVDVIGMVAISAVLERLNVRMHWAESPVESFLWDPGWLVGLEFFDGVVWAPIFEEIGCRGFLYVTVRRKLAPLPAALITGLIFGAVHLYSLPGFLMVTWSGLLWSLAYERSRSLLPGMLSHSLGNVMAFGGMLLVYRW